MRGIEKISEYQDLDIELKILWKMPFKCIPVDIGVFETIPKYLNRWMEDIGIKLSSVQLQKTV